MLEYLGHFWSTQKTCFKCEITVFDSNCFMQHYFLPQIHWSSCALPFWVFFFLRISGLDEMFCGIKYLSCILTSVLLNTRNITCMICRLSFWCCSLQQYNGGNVWYTLFHLNSSHHYYKQILLLIIALLSQTHIWKENHCRNLVSI